MDLNMKIDLKDIDVEKIIAFLKRRETIIAIFVLIFIIVVICTGNFLLGRYSEAVSERDLAEMKYNSIINADTDVLSLQKKIEEAKLENEEIVSKLSEVSQLDVAEALPVIQKETGIKWEDKTYSVKDDIKNAPNLKCISVSISRFSGTYSQLKDFLTYIKGYDKEVSIENLSFQRDSNTGKMTGNMTLVFYMKK